MSHNSDKAPPSDANSHVSRPVAALCVSGRSIYKHLPGVECFDRRRDARSFDGSTPVVAHPPCRLWSKYLSHCAKPLDAEAERELGRWCVRTVMRCGGVLEQPAHSALWAEMNLPYPGEPEILGDREKFYSIYVEQIWFGYASRKPTWILVCGVPMNQLPPLPFSLAQPRAKPARLSSFGRSRTVRPFAEWLVNVARRAKGMAA